MDPVTLAVITSAVSLLGSEYVKGIASEAGKSTWQHIRTLLGWTKDPAPPDIPVQVATAVAEAPEIGVKLYELLKNQHSAGVASAMVGTINAEKVISIQNNYGNITM